MTGGRDWRADFDRTSAADPGAAGSVQSRVWARVFGDEYPAELAPHSYISRTELQRFAHELRIGPGHVFGDLACGQGGPGLWVAAQTGARLVGLDISPVALESARLRAAALGLADQCRWVEGTFEATRLDDGSLDSVMSVDALLFTPDKGAALLEIARIMRPSGLLVFTSFDYSGQPTGRPPQVADHRPLLAAAGFTLLAYEETDQWHHRLMATGEGLLASVEELAAEGGEDRNLVEQSVREMNATLDVITRRVLVVAELDRRQL